MLLLTRLQVVVGDGDTVPLRVPRCSLDLTRFHCHLTALSYFYASATEFFSRPKIIAGPPRFSTTMQTQQRPLVIPQRLSKTLTRSPKIGRKFVKRHGCREVFINCNGGITFKI